MKDQDQKLHAMRHSLAHIMASAIQELWPDAKFGVGPVIENGFYYDVELPQPVTPADLKKIEKGMRKVVNQDQPFERIELPLSEAIAKFKKSAQVYKVSLLEDLKQHGTTVAKDIDREQLGLENSDDKVTTVSLYKHGNFEDLCRGPHVASTGKTGPFKLTKVSGAYWRGDDKNPQLQRVYGVAFETQAELDDYFNMLAEAERRDHRKLGQDLDLFVFSDLVGAGLPLFTPRGTIIRNCLDDFVQELRGKYSFDPVSIPHITKKDLYETSGHWNKFKDELFKIKSREGHEFALKPMNCPHHIQIFDSRPRSYRELPIRYRETTMVYRDEQSGELSGLSRVRSITQDDAHIFCRSSQVKDEILKAWDVVTNFYKAFGIDLKVMLSTHDPDKMEAYVGSTEQWDKAVGQLREVIEEKGVSDYVVGVGEAAFYAPKIDLIGKDVLGREFQASTIQLDFVQPKNFGLTCTNENSELEDIVMLHCAVSGSLERMMVLLIEHFAGAFPIWLAPEQIRIMSLNDSPEILDFAGLLTENMRDLGLRVETDFSNESVGKKIRNAELYKVPYSIVIGPEEVKSNRIKPRARKDLGDLDGAFITGDFINEVRNRIENRV